MADKQQKAPKPQKTPKEKAQESYKVHKEYRKLEKRDKLPGFIITIIIFVIFIGVFAGLYTQFDFELDFKPREHAEIDVSASSKVLSAQIESAFVDFFITLSDISNLANDGISFLSSNNSISDNPAVDVYLKQLKSNTKVYLKNNQKNFLTRMRLLDKLTYSIAAYGNPDEVRAFAGYKSFIPGYFHIDYAHIPELTELALDFGWDAEKIHDSFVNLEVCHRYNGVYYGYCHHDEYIPSTNVSLEDNAS